MISTKRAEANRRNAADHVRRGPGLLSGKARARRLNAVTHGLTAETLILPGEDPLAFQRRLENWTAALEPANPFEHDLVRQVVTLSWRLDRAERVQDALIADSLGSIPAEEDKRRREEVEELGRRLLPPPRGPNFVRRFGVWADLDRLAHRGPDDPDDPARAPAPPRVHRRRLPMGCSTAGPSCALCSRRRRHRLAGREDGPGHPPAGQAAVRRRRRLPGADDLRGLLRGTDRSRPDPFAELWKTTLDREAIRYRERLLGRRLREAKPWSKEHAREVLLDVVDAAVSRLVEQERQGTAAASGTWRGRCVPIRCCSTRASPEGEWVRREQGKATRAILRITERFRKRASAGRKTLSAGPSPNRRDSSRRRSVRWRRGPWSGPAATDGGSVPEAGPSRGGKTAGGS